MSLGSVGGGGGGDADVETAAISAIGLEIQVVAGLATRGLDVSLKTVAFVDSFPCDFAVAADEKVEGRSKGLKGGEIVFPLLVVPRSTRKPLRVLVLLLVLYAALEGQVKAGLM